jgi:UDP-glucose:(heptosyl)LPS alpha-1,3-glucosyltransferase
MRFAFALYNYFPYSGLARDFLRILLEANERGHTVEVFVSKWQGEKPDGVNIHVLNAHGMTNHGRNAQFHRRFNKAISKQFFDAVVGFNKMPGLDIYYGADYCYIARAKPRYGPVYRITPRYHYQHAFEHSVFHAHEKTTIFSLSSREMGVYQQHYGTPRSRFVMMPPTLDVARRLQGDYAEIRAQKRKTLGLVNERLLLFIGSGFKTKGLDRAIEAMNSLPDELKTNTRLFIVGQDNTTKTYQRQIDDLDLNKQVSFLGGRDDVPELMMAGDLLIHPAYSENTGTVILEAIISGLPVIATDVCGYALHITKANAGLILYSPFEQELLNQGLCAMLTSEKRDDWRINGLNYGKNPDLYKMPETAVSAMESWVYAHTQEATTPIEPLPHSGNVYLSDELIARYDKPLDIHTIMETAGEIIRKAPGRQTVLFDHDGKNYYIKSHTGVGWREILKNLSYLKKPVIGAQNEWHGIHHLDRINIKTMTPAGYGMVNRNPARRQSFIITEALEDTISLEEFCGHWKTHPPRQVHEIRFKRWLIQQLARITRIMHNSGANHRDYYLIHFLLRRVYEDNQRLSTEKSQLFLIDLHRMQLRKRTPYRWLVKDVAGLYFSSLDVSLCRRDLYRFMCSYTGKPLRATLEEDARFWNSVERRGLRVYKAEKSRRKPALAQTPKQHAT